MWFREYLRNRSHFVEIDGFASKLLPVRSGVPQGSVLGPLLFLVYVNDIPSLCSLSSVFMFADDTKLTSNNSCSHTHLQRDLDALYSWCQTWKVKVNSSKCSVMNFSLSSSTSL